MAANLKNEIISDSVLKIALRKKHIINQSGYRDTV